MQIIFEKLGGTCCQEGDYLLPSIEVPKVLRSAFWGSG